MKALIIKFDIFPLDGGFKAVTNQYVDVTVYGETRQEVIKSIPAAVKLALRRKYPKQAVKDTCVIESDTPHTYIAQFPHQQRAHA